MEPYAVGTHVEYHGSKQDYHGIVYEITGHYDIRLTRPDVLAHYGEEFVTQKYPDGCAYSLWPVGVSMKLDDRHLSLNSVRRESITPVEPMTEDEMPLGWDSIDPV
jgi:hypothetical protein